MNGTISKSDWLSGQKCHAMAWYEMQPNPPAPTEAELFRMQQGQEVGALARRLYPNGVLVSAINGKNAAQITKILMADSLNQVLFEATADSIPFIARADILERHDGGWHILEVKSNFADTNELKNLISDLAFTVMVFQRSGVTITKTSLLLLSRSFRFGDQTNRLFEAIEVTDQAFCRAAEFEAEADSTVATLLSDSPPAATLVSACRECAAFANKCLGVGVKHTVLEIPNLHYKKLTRLSTAGIVDIALLPPDLGLNNAQQRAWKSTVEDKPIVESGLSAALQSIAWPCHYLDFETLATVLPLYPNHGCHDQILTQFSIHHRDNIDAELTHHEFLADSSKDCQRELAESLIVALGKQGSVIVYTSFEKQRIEALQQIFPDLIAPLQEIVSRLVDIHPIIKDHVYHPDFRGSFSIKKVLPALVPDLSYQELAIRDGEAAITRFARIVRGEMPIAEVALTRQELLHYCRLDTLAMVRLHETLHKMASA